MKALDTKEMIAWIKRNIEIEERCINYYEQFPDVGKNGRIVVMHKEHLSYLRERLIMWESM